MAGRTEEINGWIAAARTKGNVTGKDLDALEALISQGNRPALRQRLLYLTSSGMSTLSLVVATEFREPTREANVTKLSPKPELPYRSVHDAIVDGWRVISFPNRDAPVDDREVNVWGYQFILEKLEGYDD